MILDFWAYFRKPYKIVNVHTASTQQASPTYTERLNCTEYLT